jgi:excisionase family DNA binding protein
MKTLKIPLLQILSFSYYESVATKAADFIFGRLILNNKILVADEVAELLRVDRQRIYELVRTNRIPVIRLGERQYRFSAQAIEEFLHGGGTQNEVERDDSD